MTRPETEKLSPIRLLGALWGLTIFLYGGEAEIRTPGALLALTRFPIVLLKPTRTPLQVVLNLKRKK